jgi:hypothetical protein
MTILEIKNKSKKPNRKVIVAWSGNAKQLKQILNLKRYDTKK